MPRFRSKPRTITAEQFRGGVESHGYKIPTGGCLCNDGLEENEHGGFHRTWHVYTMHGGQVVYLEPGDWVVPEPDGTHYYPIKDDVMKANYEQIPDDMITRP